jgi:hypothetical protein
MIKILSGVHQPTKGELVRKSLSLMNQLPRLEFSNQQWS